jgi:hypothetical protein
MCSHGIKLTPYFNTQSHFSSSHAAALNECRKNPFHHRQNLIFLNGYNLLESPLHVTTPQQPIPVQPVAHIKTLSCP